MLLRRYDFSMAPDAPPVGMTTGEGQGQGQGRGRIT
jgi:hypothetical protein